jgi:hypothetical protein
MVASALTKYGEDLVASLFGFKIGGGLLLVAGKIGSPQERV